MCEAYFIIYILFSFDVVDVDREDVCDMTLTDSAVAEFKEAVDQQVEIVLSISIKKRGHVR